MKLPSLERSRRTVAVMSRSRSVISRVVAGARMPCRRTRRRNIVVAARDPSSGPPGPWPAPRSEPADAARRAAAAFEPAFVMRLAVVDRQFLADRDLAQRIELDAAVADRQPRVRHAG